IIDADAAELVDHDCGAFAHGARQKPAHQRGLAGAEEAGDDDHRKSCAARVLEPAPEPACFTGGKKIEHRFPTDAAVSVRSSPRVSGTWEREQTELAAR